MHSADEIKHKYEVIEPLLHKAQDNIITKIGTLQNKNVHSIKYRCKSFESFYNKITRKQYTSPFKECTDLVGFRIICLFKDAIPSIIAFLNKNFTIIEEIRKEKTVDTFSYQSIHIIASYTIAGKKIPIEFQIRTILQEAWAEMEHHVNYKQIGVDRDVLRKVNALSALLEIADDQFSSIHKDFQSMKKSTSISKQNSISPEQLYHYCKKKFPVIFKHATLFDGVESVHTYEKLFNACQKKGITTIKQLESIYTKHETDLITYDTAKVKEILNNKTQWPKLYERCTKTKHFFAPAVLLNMMVEELYTSKSKK